MGQDHESTKNSRSKISMDIRMNASREHIEWKVPYEDMDLNLRSYLVWYCSYTEREILYILSRLGILDKFKSRWNKIEFLEQAGLYELAYSPALWRRTYGDSYLNADRLAAIGKRYFGLGDFAQAERNLKRARAASLYSGSETLIYMYFLTGRTEEAARVFLETCPPVSFYEELAAAPKMGEDYEKYSNYVEHLRDKYKDYSDLFFDTSKYSAKIAVYCVLKSKLYSSDAMKRLSLYFGSSVEDIQSAAKSVAGNQKEIDRLKTRIVAGRVGKVSTPETTMNEAVQLGATTRARRFSRTVIRAESIANGIRLAMQEFIVSQDPTELDRYLLFLSKTDSASMTKSFVIDALKNIQLPKPRKYQGELLLLRHLRDKDQYFYFPNEIFKWVSDPSRDVTWRQQGDQSTESVVDQAEVEGYRRYLVHTQSLCLPEDILSLIMQCDWRKTPYKIDNSLGRGRSDGLTWTEIIKNFEWLKLKLEDHPIVLNRQCLESTAVFIDHIFGAYDFLRSEHRSLSNQAKWISEEKVGNALCQLFGKSEVERHARPLWLSPQHLDFYIPKYSLAVEYMGEQHYRAIEVFGGQIAYEQNVERDRRKLELCRKIGVSIEYIRYDESIATRVKQIYEKYICQNKMP